MKFEWGLEKKRRDDIKAKGGKLKGLDVYADLNEEQMDDLLEKRRREAADLSRRQKERIKKLQQIEEEGTLYIKK